MKTKTSATRDSINHAPYQLALLFIPFAFVFFALSPQARAVCQDACLTYNNTVQGDDALLDLTTGTDNTALGLNALLSDTAGDFNTAVGSQALISNSTGGDNVAIGAQALFSNQTAYGNIAIGYQALYQDTSSGFNIAIGSLALYSNTAVENVAIGNLAARNNTTGVENTAVGFSAIYANQTGSNNCAFGAAALNINLEGSNNTAIGTEALAGNFGNNNIGIGAFAGQFVEGGSNNIEIGATGKPSDQGDIRIGTKGLNNNVHIAGIYGRTVPQGVAVVTDNLGHLGTVTCSARFKEAIKPMDKASEAILGLKPVIFRYKHELDPEGILQFGLVAEEVEKVDSDLVARDEQGKPYTVRYEAVNAMLLNEFLKEHRKVQELESIVAKQEVSAAKQDAAIVQQQKQIDALTVSLQKVNAQLAAANPSHGELEASKCGTQTVVLNNR